MKKLYNMTPREIVSVLDKYIIGQDEAKKSVAIALRNRYRRSLLPEDIQEEISPKNILMVGPTGVGKTEIARRIAKLMDAPFTKVEATKFTEVGYVGRDVDSMVRDLVEASIRLTKQRFLNEKYIVAEKVAEDKILDALMPETKKEKKSDSKNPFDFLMGKASYTTQKEQYEQKMLEEESEAMESDVALAREQVRRQLREGSLDEQIISIQVESNRKPNLGLDNEGVSVAIGSIFGDLPKQMKDKNMTVREAKKVLREQEAQNLIDMDLVIEEAISNAEQNGMIFIDEFDKIAISSDSFAKGSGSVSREGVQRDILPIVEGSVVNTKHGPVKTDHILFIGAGAFHLAKPTDLIPELQGRFPIRVELKDLTEEDFVKILTIPENAVIKQQKLLLETEGVNIEFTEDSIGQIAKLAYKMNSETENIGARRLHTIMEKLVEDISFNLPDGEGIEKEYVIDGTYVEEKFKETIGPEDLQQYII